MNALQPDEQIEDERCIQRALQVLEQRLRRGATIDHPGAAEDYLRIRLAPNEYEVFAVLWLDAQHRLIEFQELFRGTLTQAAVYPREVAREAIRHNAFACILSHNHPSGSCVPSYADMVLTYNVQGALDALGIFVLDHVIVSATGTYSMKAHDVL